MPFRDLKLEYQIWIAINFPVVNDKFILKGILKEDYGSSLKKYHLSHFLLREPLPKPKIDQPNLVLNPFSVVNDYLLRKILILGSL